MWRVAPPCAVDFMDDSPATARLLRFDPGLVTAEGLVELFPDLGLFPAEDIVEWRGKNDGAFPDVATLTSVLGVDGVMATEIAEAAVRHELADEVTNGDVFFAAAPEKPDDEVTDDATAMADVAETSDVTELVDATATAEPVADTADVTGLVEPVAAAVVEAPDDSRDSIPPADDRETGELAVATAVSESSLPVAQAAAPSAPPIRSAPPPLPVVSEPPAPEVHAEPAAAPTPAPARRSRVYYVVAALFVVNAALVAGAVRMHLEVKRAHAPIAAMSADVTDLQADQAAVHQRLEESRSQLEETRTRLEETRTRLDEQASALAATAQRQKDADREAHEREAHDARELAALTARVNRTDRHTYKLDEAIKLIDLVQGSQSARAGSAPEEHVVPIVNP